MDFSLPREDRIRSLNYNYTHKNKIFVESCNLCGASKWTIITHSDRYGFPATSMACNFCGLVVLNPQMTSDGYAEFYKDIYRPLVSAYHGYQINAETIQAEQKIYAVNIESILRFLFKDKKYKNLLDVGGSTGVVAAHLSTVMDLEATIIDPSPIEILYAQTRGIKTIVGFVEEWEPNEQYDIIGMFQTIDHLMDVNRTLSKLRSMIKKEGILIFDIVDFRAAYLRNRSVEYGTKIDHIYSLTETTTEAYIAINGFRIQMKSFNNDHLHVTYVCRPDEKVLNALPDLDSVKRMFEEIRYIQNSSLVAI
jgi:2-polyprenyl-3-methyl-5-hydroxy-6-metoxy-1,4-benzoquinol methylase